MESDATLRTLNSLISFEFSLEVTDDGDYVADEDTEDVENQVPEMC